MTLLIFITVITISWLQYSHEPWIHAQDVLVLIFALLLAYLLEGATVTLFAGGAVTGIVSLGFLPGHARYLVVREATGIVQACKESERDLSKEELSKLLEALEVAGLGEFPRKLHKTVQELLPDEEEFRALLVKMDKQGRGSTRRELRKEAYQHIIDWWVENEYARQRKELRAAEEREMARRREERQRESVARARRRAEAERGPE